MDKSQSWKIQSPFQAQGLNYIENIAFRTIWIMLAMDEMWAAPILRS